MRIFEKRETLLFIQTAHECLLWPCFCLDTAFETCHLCDVPSPCHNLFENPISITQTNLFFISRSTFLLQPNIKKNFFIFQDLNFPHFYFCPQIQNLHFELDGKPQSVSVPSVLGQDESRLAGLTFVRLWYLLCFRDPGSGAFR